MGLCRPLGGVKGMEGLERVTRMNNIGGIEYGGGSSRHSSSLGKLRDINSNIIVSLFGV